MKRVQYSEPVMWWVVWLRVRRLIQSAVQPMPSHRTGVLSGVGCEVATIGGSGKDIRTHCTKHRISNTRCNEPPGKEF